MIDAEKYANKVLSGEIVAGKWIKLSCQRFLNDLKRKDINLDLKQGQRAINFIEKKLCHWEGSWRGKPLVLEDWQKFIVMQVFGWQFNKRRRIRSVYIQIARKNGKAIALDTPIPTPNGFSTMGKLSIGDKIYGGDGTPCNVVYKSNVLENPESYLVKFSNGDYIKACADHQWQVYTKYDRKKKDNSFSVLTTKQLIPKIKEGSKLENAISIKRCSVIDSDDKQLPIDPYLFGVWLGDGISSNGAIVCGKQEDQMIAYLSTFSKKVSEDRTCMRATIPHLKVMLREIGVLDNKHIPEVYFSGSRRQRLHLLQGLMDTDGSIGGKYSQAEFCSMKYVLAYGVWRLACSFGYKCKIIEGRASIAGKDYGIKYRVLFNPDKDNNPFALTRKSDKVPAKETRRDMFYKITSIENITSEPMQCIQVDSHDQTYLAGHGYTRTHNTSFAAAILLYHLFADRENTPQILVGANNEDQAKICVNSAGRMMQQSEAFKDLLSEETVKLSIYGRNVIGIYHKEKDGAVKAMSKNPETQDGFNPSLGVVDEYHEAKDDALLNVIESGQGARPEPLLFVVTTAGFDKQGPCYSKLRKGSIDMLMGKVEDDAHLAFVFEMDEGDRWDDPGVWPKSNPNLGVSVFPEYLKSRLTKAKNEGASKEVDFKTKNLNMWVDAPTVWIQDETWMKNHYMIDPEELRGLRCYGGLDLAAGIDINAFSLYFPKIRFVNERWISAVLWWFWIPKTMVKTDHFDYTEWVEKGFIRTTSGVFENVIDHKQIINDICELTKDYMIEAVAFDQRLAYHGVVQELGVVFGTSESEEFIHGLYPFTQSMANISLSTKQLETEISNYQLEHFNNPVARWMMGNVVLKKDPIGQIMPDKSKSQYKIDGIASMVNAKAVDMRIEANGRIETQSTSL